MNENKNNNLPAPKRQAVKSKSAQTYICDDTVKSPITLGYAKTSLNVAAKKVGFSKGALQHHFAGKVDLVTATANQLLKRTDYKQQDKKVVEDIGQLMTITRNLLRGLVLQNHYEPLNDEALQLERWAGFLESVIELKSGDQP